MAYDREDGEPRGTRRGGVVVMFPKALRDKPFPWLYVIGAGLILICIGVFLGTC